MRKRFVKKVSPREISRESMSSYAMTTVDMDPNRITEYVKGVRDGVESGSSDPVALEEYRLTPSTKQKFLEYFILKLNTAWVNQDSDLKNYVDTNAFKNYDDEVDVYGTLSNAILELRQRLGYSSIQSSDYKLRVGLENKQLPVTHIDDENISKLKENVIEATDQMKIALSDAIDYRMEVSHNYAPFSIDDALVYFLTMYGVMVDNDLYAKAIDFFNPKYEHFINGLHPVMTGEAIEEALIDIANTNAFVFPEDAFTVGRSKIGEDIIYSGEGQKVLVVTPDPNSIDPINDALNEMINTKIVPTMVVTKEAFDNKTAY